MPGSASQAVETFLLLPHLDWPRSESMFTFSQFQESPIHDHPCDGCWMRCIQGAVAETRYTMPASPTAGPTPALEELSCCTLTAPGVAYIDDQQGLHKVGSVGDGPAITLHLYAPPFAECRVWLNPACPDRVLRPVVTFHSEHGSVVQYESATQRGNGCAGCAPSICDVEEERDSGAPCTEEGVAAPA